MRKFTVSVLFKNLHSSYDAAEPSLFDEAIYLVEAVSAEEVIQIAKDLAKSREHSYEAGPGDVVTVMFWAVQNVFEILDPIQHGTEIFSRTLRESEALSLLKKFD